MRVWSNIPRTPYAPTGQRQTLANIELEILQVPREQWNLKNLFSELKSMEPNHRFRLIEGKESKHPADSFEEIEIKGE